MNLPMSWTHFSNTPMPPVADLLRQAADMIRPNGAWLKGIPWDNAHFRQSRAFCASGAMFVVADRYLHPGADPNETTDTFKQNPAYHTSKQRVLADIMTIQVLKAMGVAGLVNEYFTLVNFNDHKSTSKQQVMDLLELAAKLWEEEFPDTEPVLMGEVYEEEEVEEEYAHAG